MERVYVYIVIMVIAMLMLLWIGGTGMGFAETTSGNSTLDNPLFNSTTPLGGAASP